MFYLSSVLCGKQYPTNIDVYCIDWIKAVAVITTFGEGYNYLTNIIRIHRLPPTWDLYTSCDFEKWYNTYTGAIRGLLYWLHQFDDDGYKYDNTRFQKILTISNPDKKEISLNFICKNAYKAYDATIEHKTDKIMPCKIIEM